MTQTTTSGPRPAEPGAAVEEPTIRPFRIEVPQQELDSPHQDALPLLMTHGWPGSIIELLKVIDPLTNPTAFHQLMVWLGYPRYVSQGGDWGAIIPELLAVQAPEGLLGIHVNMPGTVPPDDKFAEWTDSDDEPEKVLSFDEMLDAITLYWLTNTGTSSSRSWGERAFGNLIWWNEVDQGGHFAAWEQPELFSQEVRAAFRSLR
jgi:Epoxide hydrolase N terminus